METHLSVVKASLTSQLLANIKLNDRVSAEPGRSQELPVIPPSFNPEFTNREKNNETGANRK